jgi:outer membrane receptor protein involved in Fe transport
VQLARRVQPYSSIDLNRDFVFGYEVGTRIYAVSDRVDGTNNLAGYTVLNFYGGKRLDKDWMIRAKVENVANTDY